MKQLSISNHKTRVSTISRDDEASKIWRQTFDCTHLKPLIVCRGPVRKEAIDEFERMGLVSYGILLSEKDSILHAKALAPELRQMDPGSIHRISDYSGVDKEARQEAVSQIIQIAEEHGYNAIFAGYGFMAEEAFFVAAIEEAGLVFIGPSSHTVRAAGQKDEAKRIAESVGVTTIPGIDRLAAATLLAEYPTFVDLKRLSDQHGLSIDFGQWVKEQDMQVIADAILEKAMTMNIELFSIDAFTDQAIAEITTLYKSHPNCRVRLKAILGGGGKGQRIVPSPVDFEGELEDRILEATKDVPAMILSILSEVKATGPGDNKNILIELNIENTRHQEIQLIGNGEWALALGARDCSVQIHEQKLVEMSQTVEDLAGSIEKAKQIGDQGLQDSLTRDLNHLLAMEREAEQFAKAVELDSVSTFECIVDEQQHFFMEMNTRIQVEHRVTELCYALRFVNPENHQASFLVESIIEFMVLLAVHKRSLPCPERVSRVPASIELRLNAMNQALQPHAGGEITYWSRPVSEEIRDDQGISVRHPDTKEFRNYHILGAYDSNIALLLTAGESREAVVEKMVEIVRKMKISGDDLKVNLDFHYGVLNWLLNNGVYAKITTGFVKPYLTMLGLLKERVERVDWILVSQCLIDRYVEFGYEREIVQSIFLHKSTLITRAVKKLVERPHLFSAWLSSVGCYVNFQDAMGPWSFQWLENPIELLYQTYRLLNMEIREDQPAAEAIWSEDYTQLKEALSFYDGLDDLITDDRSVSYPQWSEFLSESQLPEKLMRILRKDSVIDQVQWTAIRSAHVGFQMGLEVLAILPLIAVDTGFYEISTDSSFSVKFPKSILETTKTGQKEKRLDLCNDELHQRMMKRLEPSPTMSGDEVVAMSGGMFYLQPAPDQPPFIKEGDLFKEGDPLYIIEVMKMFNTVRATFSGRVKKILVNNCSGEIVKKGQPLFKIIPENEEKLNPNSGSDGANLECVNVNDYVRSLVDRLYL